MNLSAALGWLISALFGVFVLYFYGLVANRGGTLSAAGPGPEEDHDRFAGKGLFLKYFGWLIEILGEYFELLPMEKRRKKLDKKLTQAGYPGGLSVDEFNAARIVALLLLGFAGMFIDNELDMFPTFVVIFALLGLVYPDLWLSGFIQRRRRRVFRDLPDLLDILRLAMDAGLDFGSAMTVVVEKGRKGPLLDELERVERDMRLGKSRSEALREFGDRLAMSEVNAFVIALIQADQLGASIGPVLKTQSEMARKRRWLLAEELVNKLPMKML
ncbi:MAG: type II secretion system F family protein, partial [Bdellovibrionales bacterium]|nr:type II secretion system F family protein [Bdellovibrionales bacterium]